MFMYTRAVSAVNDDERTIYCNWKRKQNKNVFYTEKMFRVNDCMLEVV